MNRGDKTALLVLGLTLLIAIIACQHALWNLSEVALMNNYLMSITVPSTGYCVWRYRATEGTWAKCYYRPRFMSTAIPGVP